MALPNELKEKIWLYLLGHIERGDRDYVSKTASAFEVSRTTVYNCLKRMEEERIIIRNPEGSKVIYRLSHQNVSFVYNTENRLEEDRIFLRDVRPYISGFAINVQRIWEYIFTEMMNNAIEHAEAKEIRCLIRKNYLSTAIFIQDDGIGIFRKIQRFFAEQGDDITLDEAVDALFPGKLTTSEQNHSGEGIFFSSRAADVFSIYSDGKFFSHNSFAEIRFDKDYRHITQGTVVYMKLSNSSQKQLNDVFDMFTDAERGFFKTQIPIAHMFATGYPVSRSEARRLVAFISPFEEVTLDFKDVPGIGQAFTHELFRVFQSANPDTVINTINENADVRNMIQRVKNTK